MKIKPVYTSMKCKEDQEYNDEPYAIFVGLKWDTGNGTWFVRRTTIYHYVDDGESRGTHQKYDNKTLTKTGRYENIDSNRCLILVQCLEHDKSSATRIVKTVSAVMKSIFNRPGMGAFLRSQTKSVIRGNLTSIFRDTIRASRYFPSDKYIKNFVNDLNRAGKLGDSKTFSQFFNRLSAVFELSFDIVKGIINLLNPDDIIGRPKELALNKKRKKITFSNRGGPKYEFRFSIHGVR